MDIDKNRIILKPWGREEIIEHNKYYTVKKLFLKKRHQCSFQYHLSKIETIISLYGRLKILFDKGSIYLDQGDTYTIYPNKKHRMRAESTDCVYLECSTSNLDDVIRIKDDYGRMNDDKL